MSTAMDWLADYGFIDPDDFERKDVLRRIWFTMFSGSTCGFERVFASENYGTAIIGAQDWLYFENQESLGRIDYMGYLDKLDLGNTSSLLKLNFQMDGIISQTQQYLWVLCPSQRCLCILSAFMLDRIIFARFRWAGPSLIFIHTRLCILEMKLQTLVFQCSSIQDM